MAGRPVNRDFEDLLFALSSAGAKFLLVGAHAVAYYTEPRYTKDIDIWVEPKPENARRVWAALVEFKAPLGRVAPEDFANENVVFQMGVEPNRIDILMGIDGVDFSSAWKNRVNATYGRASIALLSKSDLIRAKRAAGRPQDLLDLQRLGFNSPRPARKSNQRPPRRPKK